jgi:aldehyde:ferredoxin oxidoreductase
LKKAGYDAVVIQGISDSPCYLVIEETQCTLKPADDLWGKNVLEAREVLKQKEGDGEILAIGTAGENLVRFASIMHHHRAVGRGGCGAVMGSKRLKAVVVKGSQELGAADHEKVREISRERGRVAVETAKVFSKYGSSAAFDVFNEAHSLPTRNFQKGHYRNVEKINAEALKSGYFVRDNGCYKCPLRCGNIHSVTSGQYAFDEVEGPEYETIMSFGSNCDNDNIESILMANYLCNDFGLDTISCGNTIALLMDLFERGIIGEKDLDGFPLHWGDHVGIIKIIPKIAQREGVGDILAEGSYRAAEHWGEKALDRVIHSKKMEYPGYESRRSYGTGFSLITSNRGACHLRASLYANELLTDQIGRDDFEDHMALLIDKEHLLALIDSFLICKFAMRPAQYTWPVLTELLHALTGFDISEAEVRLAGERIWNLERIYNLGEGIEEDLPPPRLFKEDLSDGLDGGEAIGMERFVRARTLYYNTRGWNEKGIPGPEKLEELGLML